MYNLHQGVRRGWLAAALCLALTLLLPSRAQAVARDVTGRGVGFSSVLYDSTSGLPTSDANAIAQSEDGFIWIGGYSGLVRYDGNEFYRYPSSTGVSSVVSLYVDSRQRLWVGTNDSGIAVLDGSQFTFYGQEDGLRSSSIRSILEDENGDILIATTMGMACVDAQGVFHTIDEPQINTEYICELVAGPEGTIYGITLTGDVFTVQNRRVNAYYSGRELSQWPLYTVYPDPDRPGYVYLGTEESVILYGRLFDKMADAEVIHVEPQRNISALRCVDGMVWVCADNGIGFLNQQREYTPLTDVPMTNSVDHIMVDFEDNLWFTSSRQGVMKIVENRFNDLSQLSALPNLVVNTTCLHEGALYLGTDSGLYILDREGGQTQNELTELLQGMRIRCIREDSRGVLWLCTFASAGLVRYDSADGSIRSYTSADGLASDRARNIMERQDGTLAVGTNGGVSILRDDQVAANYTRVQGISNEEILCLAEDREGRLYIGSDGDGIYVTDGGALRRIGRKDGLRSEVILRMVPDSVEDALWVITSNSIAYLKDGAARTICNFPYPNNYDLYFNAEGEMWILSSNGIYVLDREEMLADQEDMEYTLYNMESGLPFAPTANSFSFLAEDGTLYISGSSGVASVDINAAAYDNSTVRLAVSGVEADGRSIPNTEGLVRIGADTRRLTVYPYALTYSLNNPRVSYYLEGFDRAPIETTKKDLEGISYTNLEGGTYVFHLSVLNTKTGQEEQTMALTIVKDMAIYERLWFKILVTLLGAGLVAGAVALIYRHKTRALIRKQQEKQRLIDEMTAVFSHCVDMKDAYTNGHSARVAKYTGMLAREMGKSEEEVRKIYNIALLHDVGKISIPDNILQKPGRLTDEEYVVMKSHSSVGRDILNEVAIEPELALGAGYHHERYDGKGYPDGLKGEEIPEEARIIAVADTFDAMYSTRPYRRQLPLSTVVKEIRRVSGTQLDPRVVEAFLRLAEKGAFGEYTPEEDTDSAPPAGTSAGTA